MIGFVRPCMCKWEPPKPGHLSTPKLPDTAALDSSRMTVTCQLLPSPSLLVICAPLSYPTTRSMIHPCTRVLACCRPAIRIYHILGFTSKAVTCSATSSPAGRGMLRWWQQLGLVPTDNKHRQSALHDTDTEVRTPSRLTPQYPTRLAPHFWWGCSAEGDPNTRSEAASCNSKHHGQQPGFAAQLNTHNTSHLR